MSKYLRALLGAVTGPNANLTLSNLSEWEVRNAALLDFFRSSNSDVWFCNSNKKTGPPYFQLERKPFQGENLIRPDLKVTCEIDPATRKRQFYIRVSTTKYSMSPVEVLIWPVKHLLSEQGVDVYTYGRNNFVTTLCEGEPKADNYEFRGDKLVNKPSYEYYRDSFARSFEGIEVADEKGIERWRQKCLNSV